MASTKWRSCSVEPTSLVGSEAIVYVRLLCVISDALWFINLHAPVTPLLFGIPDSGINLWFLAWAETLGITVIFSWRVFLIHPYPDSPRFFPGVLPFYFLSLYVSIWLSCILIGPLSHCSVLLYTPKLLMSTCTLWLPVLIPHWWA